MPHVIWRDYKGIEGVDCLEIIVDSPQRINIIVKYKSTEGDNFYCTYSNKKLLVRGCSLSQKPSDNVDEMGWCLSNIMTVINDKRVLEYVRKCFE